MNDFFWKVKYNSSILNELQVMNILDATKGSPEFLEKLHELTSIAYVQMQDIHVEVSEENFSPLINIWLMGYISSLKLNETPKESRGTPLCS